MIPRTRPLPVLLSLHQSRVNRIPLHISNGGKQMTLVHWIGMEALLPQVTPPTTPPGPPPPPPIPPQPVPPPQTERRKARDVPPLDGNGSPPATDDPAN